MMTSVDVIVVCRSMLNYRERGVVMSVLMMVVCDLSRYPERVSRVSDAFNESEAALPRPNRSACMRQAHQSVYSSSDRVRGRSSSSHGNDDTTAIND